MFIEVKVKVSWVIDNKIKKKLETYIIDKEVFAEAEYEVMTLLTAYKNEGTVEDFEITSLKQSSVKEIITNYQGDYSFIASLRYMFIQDDGTEKAMKYKTLLWANNISEAMSHTRELTQQGYDMQIDSLKEVNYTYLNSEDNETSDTEN